MKSILIFLYMQIAFAAQIDSLNVIAYLDSFNVAYNHSYSFDDEDKKMAAFELAEKQLNNAFLAGLADSKFYARLALLSGVRAKTVSLGNKGPFLINLERYAHQALELDSMNAIANSMLGILHFRLSTLSWIEKIVSRAFIGSLPESSIEFAHQSFLKAIKVDPNRVSYHFFLAKSFYELDQLDQSIIRLKTAIRLNAQTAADQFYQNEAKMMLEDVTD